MSEIVVVRRGAGPDVLLVHGGAGPRTTWGALDALAQRWRLGYVYRRGFPPSPPTQPRQDFDIDAADLATLLDGRPHIVAHSYGALGSLIAAAAAPRRVRSLTLLEAPLNYLLPDDAEVTRLQRLADTVVTNGMQADDAELREFLRLAGSPVGDGPLPAEVVTAMHRAHGTRPTGEARPDLKAIRDAGIPVLVASGDHHPALERICDAIATELHGERGVFPGAGHFVAAAPDFAAALEAFLHRATVTVG